MSARTRLPRGLRRLLLAAATLALMLGLAPAAHAATSSNVAYVFDFGSGSNDASFPGSSIFVNALTGAVPAGTYTTADVTKTVTVTDVPLAAVTLAALTPFDTVILYEVCSIGASGNASQLAAINQYLLNGGKLMIFDADKCFDGTPADYTNFLFPFATSSPGPAGASGSYTNVQASTLTTGLAVGPQPGDAVGDSNTFTTFNNKWCGSITAQNTLGNDGFVEAYARTPAGGLVIYEGEDYWFTFGPTSHLRQVFDLMLEQDFNPDGLPCALPASGIKLAPPAQSHLVGQTASVTATVVDADNNGQANINVTCTVLSGPDAGPCGSGNTDGSGNVTFTYVCQKVGTDTVEATFTDEFLGVHHSNDVTVDCTDPPISATPVTFAATEGASFTGVVANFTDPDLGATASEYTATILWGDGSSSTGTIVGAAGSFTVSDTHTYVEEGTYAVTVTITDTDTPTNTATAISKAIVADATLTSSCAAPMTSTQAFSGPVANLIDANPGGTLSDFSASIDWGDGTSTSTPMVTINGSGPFVVSGSHSYGSTGIFTIKTTIKDVGGNMTSTSCSVVVFAFAPGGGSFVIGDQNSAKGTPVTFWGAQWWKLNSLSGGAAPASFKGFAENPATPSCGAGWSTDPGNSTPPPAGPLPTLMGVIVTSSSTKSGSTISGDIRHIVVVQTNAGYAPNPGHAGTGTVVIQVC